MGRGGSRTTELQTEGAITHRPPPTPTGRILGVLTSSSTSAAPSSTTEAPPGAAPAALEAPPVAPALGRGGSGGGSSTVEALEAAAAPEGGGASVKAFLGGGSRFAPLLVVLPNQFGRFVPLQLHEQHRVQEIARLRQREVGWGGGGQ